MNWKLCADRPFTTQRGKSSRGCKPRTVTCTPYFFTELGRLQDIPSFRQVFYILFANTNDALLLLLNT
jgi:hypothetical protein